MPGISSSRGTTYGAPGPAITEFVASTGTRPRRSTAPSSTRNVDGAPGSSGANVRTVCHHGPSNPYGSNERRSGLPVNGQAPSTVRGSRSAYSATTA